MLQELSLHGSVPASRHGQILRILAGVAGSPPTALREQHKIYRPTRGPVRKTVHVGGTQNIQDAQKAAKKAAAEGTSDLYFLRCVRTLNPDEDTPQILQPDTAMDLDRRGPTKLPSTTGLGTWSLHFYETPEFGSRPVTVRNVNVTPLSSTEPDAFMAAMGYKSVNQCIFIADRFVYNNIVIRLLRLHLPEIASQPDSEQSLLDQSGAYVLEAYVRIADGSGPEILRKGEAELLRLRETLRGVVDLRVVDRFSLDTRIK